MQKQIEAKSLKNEFSNIVKFVFAKSQAKSFESKSNDITSILHLQL